MVICLERGADLHMAQLMPLPLTVYCFSKIHIGFTFLVPAHLGSPGQRAVKRVCVCVCVVPIRRSLLSLSGGLCGPTRSRRHVHGEIRRPDVDGLQRQPRDVTPHVTDDVIPHVRRQPMAWRRAQLLRPRSATAGYCLTAWDSVQGCSGAGTRWNAVPEKILEPERRSGKYRWPQVER